MTSDPLGLIGQILHGQFRVDELVEDGARGVVYRGQHLMLEAPIAIKCMKSPPGVAPDHFIRRFRHESRLHYKLSQASPAIVRVLASGTAVSPSTGDLCPFTVLEWLEGQTLAEEFVARRAKGMRGRSLVESMRLLDPAVEALAMAHAHGVVHREVTPDRLFLATTPEGTRLKVLDFGVAKIVGDQAFDVPAPSQSMGLAPIGLPGYAAPEQFSTSAGSVGPWTDVYATVIVLLEMLRDWPVLDEDGPPMALRVLDPANRPTPRALGILVGDHVEEVLARAVSVNVADRPQDAGELWGMLKNAVHRDEDGARTTTTKPTAQGAPNAQAAPPTPATRPADVLHAAQTAQAIHTAQTAQGARAAYVPQPVPGVAPTYAAPAPTGPQAPQDRPGPVLHGTKIMPAVQPSGAATARPAPGLDSPPAHAAPMHGAPAAPAMQGSWNAQNALLAQTAAQTVQEQQALVAAQQAHLAAQRAHLAPTMQGAQNAQSALLAQTIAQNEPPAHAAPTVQGAPGVYGPRARAQIPPDALVTQASQTTRDSFAAHDAEVLHATHAASLAAEGAPVAGRRAAPRASGSPVSPGAPVPLGSPSSSAPETPMGAAALLALVPGPAPGRSATPPHQGAPFGYRAPHASPVPSSMTPPMAADDDDADSVPGSQRTVVIPQDEIQRMSIESMVAAAPATERGEAFAPADDAGPSIAHQETLLAPQPDAERVFNRHHPFAQTQDSTETQVSAGLLRQPLPARGEVPAGAASDVASSAERAIESVPLRNLPAKELLDGPPEDPIASSTPPGTALLPLHMRPQPPPGGSASPFYSASTFPTDAQGQLGPAPGGSAAYPFIVPRPAAPAPLSEPPPARSSGVFIAVAVFVVLAVIGVALAIYMAKLRGH